MRLVKYLAHSGVASRRRAEEIIAAGRVRVGGSVVRDPARDVEYESGVEVDGRQVGPEPREVWMLNKPTGVTSTAREPGSRRAVTDLIGSRRRLYPVGRLDAESTGLILITNDGELANRLMHPKFEVPRTYRARLRRPPTDTDIGRLRDGVMLDDGPTAPAKIRRVSPRVLEITLREGRNRQIRRMAEAIENHVVELERISFGPLRLGELPRGQARLLKPAELRLLWKDSPPSRSKR
jgi:23S rRNA pseudouridine2605 synthase